MAGNDTPPWEDEKENAGWFSVSFKTAPGFEATLLKISANSEEALKQMILKTFGWEADDSDTIASLTVQAEKTLQALSLLKSNGLSGDDKPETEVRNRPVQQAKEAGLKPEKPQNRSYGNRSSSNRGGETEIGEVDTVLSQIEACETRDDLRRLHAREIKHFEGPRGEELLTAYKAKGKSLPA